MEYDFSKKISEVLHASEHEESEEKYYDHEMEISEEQMNELHEKGVTYITETDNGRKMVIKVEYYKNKKDEQ